MNIENKKPIRMETCKKCFASKEHFLIEKNGECFSCNYIKRGAGGEVFFKPYRFGKEISGFRNS